MSRAPRWILGSFAILFALCFVSTSRNSSAPWIDWGLVAFCLAIGIACFSKKWRQPAIRFIGVTVFLGYLAYFVLEVTINFRKPYAGRSEPHWLNALMGMFTFGLPGIYVLIKGIYPRWGLRSDVFRGDEEDSSSIEKSNEA